MVVNISYLEVPLYDKVGILKDNMHYTAEPLYQNKDVEWSKLISIINSDYRQYSPYRYKDKTKKSINWNNDKQNLLIFDIDDGMTLQEAKDMFFKYKYLIATTKSHQKDKKGIVCDRFRLILPAINIPTDKEVYFEMLRVFESYIPIDPQANQPSNAFLGSYGCEYWYNEGEEYDCEKAKNIAEERVADQKKDKLIKEMKKVEIDTDFDYDAEAIRDKLTVEIACDILDHLGFEIVGNKFKLRPEERTASAVVYDRGYVKDYGGESMSVFDLVMEVKGLDFRSSLAYVNDFIKE